VSNVQLDDNIRIYDCWKRKGLSRHRKLENVGAETTSSGSPFQIRGPETRTKFSATDCWVFYQNEDSFRSDRRLVTAECYKQSDSQWSVPTDTLLT